MADDEVAPMSVKDRIARLRLDQVGKGPGQQNATPPQPTPPPSSSTAGRARPPAPPPPPAVRPEVPSRPTIHGRTNSTNNPPTRHYGSATDAGSIGNEPAMRRPTGASSAGMDGIARPALPPRTSTQSNGTCPSLPPRRPSELLPALPPRRPSETPSHPDTQLSRRTSSDSVSSIATARSSVSGTSTERFAIRAPAFDPTKLPTLPPKRTDAERESYYNVQKSGRRPLKSTNSSPNIHKQNDTTPPPSRPAGYTWTIPSRPEPIEEQEPPLQIEQAPTPVPPRNARAAPPPPPARESLPPPQPARPPRRSPLEYGMNKSTNTAPPVPTRPGSTPAIDPESRSPPPVPTGSRPNLASLQATKPKSGWSGEAQRPASSQSSCLLCRDFSGPDNHAARFPRESIPSSDVGWLAMQLTGHFDSLTDKARALFTWLHHNVAYDFASFANRDRVPLKASTPHGTIQSGLAVCEGYAALFAALAMKAGLEALVVSGHGRGFGDSAWLPGNPVPPYEGNHAWNVVKIDNGEWKLIDACWGAGNVDDKRPEPYEKKFSQERFTQSNEDFGRDHFPSDVNQQFRNDGRVMTWEAYITGNKDGCGAQFFSGYVATEGFNSSTFRPLSGNIVLAQQGPTVRFSFQKICPHWDQMRNGKGPYYLYFLKTEGKGNEPTHHVPFETNGEVWWCDVPTSDLGGAGNSVHICVVETFDNKEARGLTKKQYLERNGRVGQSWGYVCRWTVA